MEEILHQCFCRFQKSSNSDRCALVFSPQTKSAHEFHHSSHTRMTGLPSEYDEWLIKVDQVKLLRLIDWSDEKPGRLIARYCCILKVNYMWSMQVWEERKSRWYSGYKITERAKKKQTKQPPKLSASIHWIKDKVLQNYHNFKAIFLMSGSNSVMRLYEARMLLIMELKFSASYIPEHLLSFSYLSHIKLWIYVSFLKCFRDPVITEPQSVLIKRAEQKWAQDQTPNV